MLNKHFIGGVGIIFAEEWIDKILSVVRINHRIITLKLFLGKITLSIFCVCAPQCGRPCEEKDDFYLGRLSNISTVSPDCILIVWRDLNGHMGEDSGDVFKGIHRGYGYGIINADGTRVPDMCATAHLLVANSFSKDIN